jgi:two-component system chemotaxis response regulator CheB
MIQFGDDDIEIIMGLARELTGTRVNAKQHSIVIQKVAARIFELGLDDLESYLYLVDETDDEISYLISALTIHTTGWFREPSAFEKLDEVLLKKFSSNQTPAHFRVLSAACSTGEEVWSIAAVLESFARTRQGFTWEIEAWDIDPISLRVGRAGVYESRALEAVAENFRLRLDAIGQTVAGRDGFFEILPKYRENCRFRAVNILKQPEDSSVFDFIMCRNVLIYFDPVSVTSIVSQFKKRLSLSGLLCVGVSETSALSTADFSSIGAAVYGRAGGQLMSITGRSHGQSQRAPIGNVVVVEDEPELRVLMVEFLEETGYRVLSASNAQDAEPKILGEPTSLVLCDYRMPGANGLELCARIRSKGYRGAFVIISGHADRGMAEEGLRSGCNDVVLKPLLDVDLVALVRSYIGAPQTEKKVLSQPSMILMGASTGGTEVLVRILRDLPRDVPPVLVVQHIISGFAKDFGERLAKVSGLTLGACRPDEPLQKGHLYISLGEWHIGVKDDSGKLMLVCNRGPAVNGHRPSVDFLFQSAAVCRQRRIFAALLTGMGRDGADGLLALKNSGAETFAQSEDTCAVFGMPREAIRLNAAQFILSPEDIRKKLLAVLLKDSKVA